MTLLTVTRDVCAAVGVEIPTSVLANLSGNRTMQEMLALATEMAQRIAGDTRDWTALRSQCVFQGDGVKTEFPLPVDYRRMPVQANVWLSTSTQSPARFVPSTDEWLRRRAAQETNTAGEWTILGGSMHIYPVMPMSTSAWFVYLSRNCIIFGPPGSNPPRGDTFVNDTDRYVLDERLLKLGMIWQWKANKGTPYVEDMGTYTDALANAMGPDSPAPMMAGHAPLSTDAAIAYPYATPTGPIPYWPYP